MSVAVMEHAPVRDGPMSKFRHRAGRVIWAEIDGEGARMN